MPLVQLEFHHCRNRQNGPQMDEAFLDQLAVIATMPDADRDMRITENEELKRSCFLDDAQVANGVLLGVLSHARYDYRPPVIDVETKERRGNPKTLTEGDEAKTYFALRAADGLLVIQRNRDGASVSILRRYINEKWEEITGRKVGFKTGVRLDPGKLEELLEKRVTAVRLIKQIRPTDDDTALGQLHQHAPRMFDTAQAGEVTLKVDRGAQFGREAIQEAVNAWRGRQVSGMYLRAGDEGQATKWFNLEKLKYTRDVDVPLDLMSGELVKDRMYVRLEELLAQEPYVQNPG